MRYLQLIKHELHSISPLPTDMCSVHFLYLVIIDYCDNSLNGETAYQLILEHCPKTEQNFFRFFVQPQLLRPQPVSTSQFPSVIHIHRWVCNRRQNFNVSAGLTSFCCWACPSNGTLLVGRKTPWPCFWIQISFWVMISPVTHTPPSKHLLIAQRRATAVGRGNWICVTEWLDKTGGVNGDMCVWLKGDGFYWLWEEVKREKSAAERKHLPLHNKEGGWIQKQSENGE